MTQIATRPMLAVPLEWKYLRYPVLASAKIDGIRCIVRDGTAWTRTGKQVPNRFLQMQFGRHAALLEGCDGELVVGSPAAPDVFNVTTSGVMSQAGMPEFRYFIFDDVRVPRASFRVRWNGLHERAGRLPDWAFVHPQHLLDNRLMVEAVEADMLASGYEGLILRDPESAYKFGRATARSGAMFKLKRYADAEARVLGSQELMHNENAPAVDAQGLTRRSHVQAGLVPSGMLGALDVALLGKPDVTFSIGSGFTTAQREQLWRERGQLPGRIARFRYLPHGMLASTGVPRHPVFTGFRDPDDVS